MWGNPFEEEKDEFAGYAPLTKSCLNNHVDFVVNYVTSLPSDRVFEEVNHKDPLLYGDTPLMLAATYGYHEIVSFLLKSGARKDIRTYRGTVYEQIKEKHDRLAKEIVDANNPAHKHTKGKDSSAMEEVRKFNAEHSGLNARERDKLAKVLEILNAHTDPTNVCVVCHSPNHLRQCSKCRAVQYCSKECQIHDWMHGHKKVCAATESSV